MNPDPICTIVEQLYNEFGKPGLKPQLAIISEDCREVSDASLTGHAAIYLGDFYMPSVLDFRDLEDSEQARENLAEQSRLHDALCVHPDEYPEETEFDVSMPLLISDSGEIIWGCECYWGAVDAETMVLAEQFGIRDFAEAAFELISAQFKSSAAYSGLRRLIEIEYAKQQQEGK